MNGYTVDRRSFQCGKLGEWLGCKQKISESIFRDTDGAGAEAWRRCVFFTYVQPSRLRS